MPASSFSLSTGEEIPLLLESRRGLRNISIRPKITPKREIRISLPRIASVSSAMKFLEQKRAWIEKIYAAAPQKIRLKNGDEIEIFGQKYIISQEKIGGSPEFLERRLRDKIKAKFLQLAKQEIAKLPPEFRPKKIAAHDTVSRWGSCSSTGTISFSWWLALAPPEIMRYVICHECAHRKHMDHSPAFWAQCAKLYGPGVGRAKLWLSKNGSQLHRYF
jgi:predicted metal-dependent hydrolase